MKKLIRSILVPIFLSIIMGVVFGRFVFMTYKKDIYGNLKSGKIYLIQNGEYSSFDNMREKNGENDYIYYKDNDKYMSVVGITRNYDNVDKIKRLYDGKLKVMEYYVPMEKINSKQDEYDKLLLDASDDSEVKNILYDILKLYKEEEEARLVSIN